MRVQVSPSPPTINTLLTQHTIILETNFLTLEGCSREVEISLTTNELQPHFDKAYRDAIPEIEINGFRKGKAPLSIVKQKFGQRIENDSLESIADETFRTLITENDLKVIGQPTLRDLRKEPTKTTFVVRYDVLPEVDLHGYQSLTLKKPIFTVSEEDVEKELDAIALNNGTTEVVDNITSYQVRVKIKAHELDPVTGMPIIGGKSNDDHFYLDHPDIDQKFKENFLNLKVGDSFRFAFPHQHDHENEQEHDHDHDHSDVPSLVEIISVENVVPAELTDTLIDTVTKGRLTSISDAREDIKKSFNQYWETESRKLLETQIVDQLVTMHEFPLPESLVWQLMNEMVEDIKRQYANSPGIENLTVQQMATQIRPQAEKLAKWEIIRSEIALKEELKITEEELTKLAGESNVSLDQLQQYIQQNPSFIARMLSGKVFENIIETAVFVEVPADEFEQM